MIGYAMQAAERRQPLGYDVDAADNAHAFDRLET